MTDPQVDEKWKERRPHLPLNTSDGFGILKERPAREPGLNRNLDRCHNHNSRKIRLSRYCCITHSVLKFSRGMHRLSFVRWMFSTSTQQRSKTPQRLSLVVCRSPHFALDDDLLGDRFPLLFAVMGSDSPRRKYSPSRGMEALEMEMLLTEELPRFRKSLFRGRVKSLFVCVCVLVAIALLLNVTASSQFIVDPSMSVDKDRSTRVPTTAPTLRPTHAPTAAPSRQLVTYSDGQSAPVAIESKWWSSGQESNYQRPLLPMPENASAIFTDRWCDLSRVDWFPQGDKAWQQHAPLFLIPGAKASGATELADLLSEHPSITPPRHFGFFFNTNFRHLVSPSERTKVHAARERLYARHVAQNSTTFDGTSGYLFYSTLLPRRILCVLPWVKLVVVLNHPVDRVWQHYQLARRKGLRSSLEDWIDKDFALLKQVGLLQNWTMDSIRKFTGSRDEDEAWFEYQSRSLEGTIGRSMYEVQLRQWFQAFRAAGFEPSDRVLLVDADGFLLEPKRHYQEILQFLELPQYTYKKSPKSTKATESMDPATRHRLDQFFQPYNAMLQSLIRMYGISMIT